MKLCDNNPNSFDFYPPLLFDTGINIFIESMVEIQRLININFNNWVSSRRQTLMIALRTSLLLQAVALFVYCRDRFHPPNPAVSKSKRDEILCM